VDIQSLTSTSFPNSLFTRGTIILSFNAVLSKQAVGNVVKETKGTIFCSVTLCTSVLSFLLIICFTYSSILKREEYFPPKRQ
jgi:hypothetical protein